LSPKTTSRKFSNVNPTLWVIESTVYMLSHPRRSSILLFCCMALFADAARGQSLSIIRKGKSELWVNAAAPLDTQYILQASRNLELWVDLNDEVSDQVSNRVDNAGVTERFFRLMPWTPPAPPITIVLLGGTSEFVLSSSGHIQAIVNPPSNPKASYFTRLGEPPASAEQWQEEATRQPGSWWNHWTQWLTAHSGKERNHPDALGNDQHPPLEPAPGRYVHLS
jgi:hypothetical protein